MFRSTLHGEMTTQDSSPCYGRGKMSPTVTGASLVIEEHAIEMGESETLQSALEMVAEVPLGSRSKMGTIG